jgi:hypothetical protein
LAISKDYPGGVERGDERRLFSQSFFAGGANLSGAPFVVLFPLFFGLCFPADSPGPLIIPATVFLAGLAWMLSHRLFTEESAPAPPRIQPLAVSRQVASPPPPAPAAVFSAPRANPAGIAPPPSVTEPTTGLLNDR